MTDPLDLDSILARADAASRGPWRAALLDVEDDWADKAGIYEGTYPIALLSAGVAVPDAVFIAAARTDIPALVAECRALRGEVERLTADSACPYGTCALSPDWTSELGAALIEARAALAESQAEVERLTRWKAEAMDVLDGWEDVWVALGMPGPLGVQKSQAVRAYIAERDATIAAVRRLTIQGDQSDRHINGYGYVLVRDLNRVLDARNPKEETT